MKNGNENRNTKNAMTTSNKSAITAPPRHGRKPGRKTVFTAATRSRLIDLCAAGVPFRHACAVVRISYSAFAAYRNTHPKFEAQLQEAIGAAIEKHLKRIEDAAAQGDVASSRWYLERCHPEFFSRSRLELSGANGTPLAGAIALYLPQKNSEPKPVEVVSRKALPSDDERD